jgi:hypothetical protein
LPLNVTRSPLVLEGGDANPFDRYEPLLIVE